jgi:DNA-binding transcriptional ArsR family regulator
MAKKTKSTVKPSERFGTVARTLKTVAHPERLAILELLGDKELSVNEVAEAIGAKQSITSHHLNLMRVHGVLYDRREGVKVFYGIKNKGVNKLLECIYQNCKESV